jgi:hypothetical protein
MIRQIASLADRTDKLEYAVAEFCFSLFDKADLGPKFIKIPRRRRKYHAE